MRDWASTIRRAFEAAGKTPDADVLEELTVHAAAEYDAMRQRGADEAEAERRVASLIAAWAADAAALERRVIPLPSVPAPTTHSTPLIGLLHDVRYGARLLRREPGMAVIAILTLALGIAATTTLFSVANGVLLEPLPWPDGDRIMRVTETRAGRAGRVAGTISNATYLAWRDQASTIQDLGGWLTQTQTMIGAGDPVRLSVIPVTASLFRILQTRPLLGRLFEDGEGRQGDPG